jgi:hypothetical protein
MVARRAAFPPRMVRSFVGLVSKLCAHGELNKRHADKANDGEEYCGRPGYAVILLHCRTR